MKQFIAILVVALMLAGTAGAAQQARDPRVPALQRQVSSLRTSVSSLQTQLAETQRAVVLVNDKDSCTTALTWDAIRILSAGLFGGDIGRLDDGGSCSRVGINRPVRNVYQAQQKPSISHLFELAEQATKAR